MVLKAGCCVELTRDRCGANRYIRPLVVWCGPGPDFMPCNCCRRRSDGQYRWNKVPWTHPPHTFTADYGSALRGIDVTHHVSDRDPFSYRHSGICLPMYVLSLMLLDLEFSNNQ
jgi:hypothetical protein